MATLSPQDFHNTLADVDDSHGGMESSAQGHNYIVEPVAARSTELELAAFEKGRLQGEVEAVRRLEAEGQLNQNKAFNNYTTIVNQNLATASVVEIQHLSWTQRGAALLGEICGVAFIVLMAILVSEYRGGVDWSNGNHTGNAGMFNVHLIAGFAGLWFAAQAYTLYRILPLHTAPGLNKLMYVMLHVGALASFGVVIAAATKAQPGRNAHSMHAWTSYLAVFVYALHAFYSCMKIMLTRASSGIEANEWNETRDATGATRNNAQTGGMPTLYRAQPHHNRSKQPAVSYNADGSAVAAPTWSESPAYTANNFFLIPRAKWATIALVGLGAATLIGIGSWESVLAMNRNNWPQGDAANRNGEMAYDSIEGILIATLGLVTLVATMCFVFVAMPPRTLLAQGSGVAQPIAVAANRNSISTNVTQPNTRLAQEQEVV